MTTPRIIFVPGLKPKPPPAPHKRELLRNCEVRRRERFFVTAYIAQNGRVLSAGAVQTAFAQGQTLDGMRAWDVRRAMATLSARDRKVLMLHAWEGLDGEGLAKALGVTRGGAAAALSRARARLREAWAT